MQSVWEQGSFCKKFPEVTRDLKTDILVIGGGMVGVLCAHKLQEAGREVVLVEAERIGSGVTARTTAVLTAQHDVLYQDMAKQFNMETAHAYLHANLNAVQSFRKMAKHIDCDFADMPSIQFCTGQKQRLNKELQTVNALGFSAQFCKDIPIPDVCAEGIIYPGMAQFHPLKFLGALAEKLNIFENNRVLNIDATTAYLHGAKIRANKIIVATHFPFIDRHGLFFMKLYQNRSYILALENAPKIDVTMAELEGDGVYLRPYGELLLLGGGDHRTGKKGGGFQFLREYAMCHFPKSKEKFAWANQDCMSLDGLPYVGQYSPNMPNIYVATGFNAWGMTNSMVAAQLLTDIITGKENPLQEILSPDRTILRKQLFCNLGQTVLDFAIPTTKRCSHLGCALRWNKQEHSWDCPCHGSRFDEKGRLLDTPAQKDI